MNGKPQLSEEFRRVPFPAKVIAALIPICVFGAVALFRLLSAAPAPAVGRPAELQIGIAALLFFLVTVLAAIWVLLVGYVYADAGRRGMSRLLWMLVVIFVPNAIGFILYFILRQPVMAECPGCRSSLDAEVAYCPKCGVQVAQSCPGCGRPVGLSDAFCSACGHNVKVPTEQPG